MADRNIIESALAKLNKKRLELGRDLNLNGEEEVLISEENFPDNIQTSFYDKQGKRIYLSDANSLYMYDLESESFRRVGSYDKKFEKLYIYYVPEDGGICVLDQYKGFSQTKGRYLVDHTTAKIIEEDSTKCIVPRQTETAGKEPFEDFLKELNLPENIRYETELVDRLEYIERVNQN